MDLLEVLLHLRHKPFHGGGKYTLHLDLNLACRRVPCNETSFQCIVKRDGRRVHRVDQPHGFGDGAQLLVKLILLLVQILHFCVRGAHVAVRRVEKTHREGSEPERAQPELDAVS